MVKKEYYMQGFVKRMHEEENSLQGKINKLDKFINDTSIQAKFKTLSEEEQELDKKQLEYMKGYLEILQKRIKLHENDQL